MSIWYAVLLLNSATDFQIIKRTANLCFDSLDLAYIIKFLMVHSPHMAPLRTASRVCTHARWYAKLNSAVRHALQARSHDNSHAHGLLML
jgi:hypothetical protein